MLNFRRVYDTENVKIAINLIFYNITDETTWDFKKTIFTLRCWSYMITQKRISEIGAQWSILFQKIGDYTRYDNNGYKFSSFSLTDDDHELTVNTIESLFRFDENDLKFSTFKWNDAFYQLMEAQKLTDFEITFHRNDKEWTCYLFFDGRLI